MAATITENRTFDKKNAKIIKKNIVTKL